MADAGGEQAEPQQTEGSEESNKELTEEELEGDEALRACLIVCGLNEQQQNAVLGEGFLDLMSFCSMHCSSLSEMVKHIGSLTRNSVCINEYHLHNMEASAWPIHDQRHHNREIYAEEFDVEIMEACLNELELESKEGDG
jgi:hypothetical protein